MVEEEMETTSLVAQALGSQITEPIEPILVK
jgi:hypothetical protein